MAIKSFKGKKILIRKLCQKDLKEPEKFRDFVNSLISEDAKLLINKKQTRKDEIDWLKDGLKSQKTKKMAHLVAESEGKVVAGANLRIEKYRKNHIAEFGISIKDGYRGIGLGTYLMSQIIKLAKKDLRPKPKFIKLGVFANNPPAIGLYKKMGFKQVARIPKQLQYKGKLVDEIIMLLES